MTVRELMTALSTLDQDMPVLVYEVGNSGMDPRGYRDTYRLLTVRVAPRTRGRTYYPRFLTQTERNTVTAVCLE